MVFARYQLLIIVLALTVFSARAADGERPGFRQRCNSFLSRAVDKCFEFELGCHIKMMDLTVRSASAIDKAIDRLPAPVAQAIRKVSAAMSDVSTSRHTYVLGELMRNIGSYAGDFPMHYNLAALRVHAQYAIPFHLRNYLFGPPNKAKELQSEKIVAVLNSALPGWENDEEVGLLEVEQDVSLYSANGTLTTYSPGSIVVIKGQVVIGVVSFLRGEPTYKAAE